LRTGSEKFTRHWDDEKYQNFRKQIHRYRTWIDDAYIEQDRDESIRKWRRVFGEDFAEGEVIEKAKNVSGIALGIVNASATNLVEAIKRGASYVLNRIPSSLPHVKPIPWKPARQTISVSINATEHHMKKGNLMRQLSSGNIISKGRGINFIAIPPLGIPKTFAVQWRVVNTGEEAGKVKEGLRGGFYNSESHNQRWDETSYTGVHWVEAFVVNERTNECVGRSERFL
jgi:hypothetical protein